MKRKAPLPVPVSDGGLEFEIDTYLKKSPIISQFREDNPNLQQFSETEDGNGWIENSTARNFDHSERQNEFKDEDNDNAQTLENQTLSRTSSSKLKHRLKRLSTTQSLNSKFGRLNISRLHEPNSDDEVGESVTPFWKYHVLKFGKDLYLSTNPDIKHIYCRNGPGLYVQIVSASGGYLLLFRDVEGIEHPPFMTILKRGKNFVVYDVGEVICLPVDKLEESNPWRLADYNFSFQGSNWKVGSIPKTRLSKMNKIKGIVRGEEEQLKYVGKRNLYFYDGNDTQTILGLFRPQEVKLRKKIVRSARHAMKREDLQHFGDSELAVGSNVHKFFQSTGDGVFNEANPVDDMPNKDKLGWITIYENYEGLNSKHPLFNIILGITLAIGYEQSIIE